MVIHSLKPSCAVCLGILPRFRGFLVAFFLSLYFHLLFSPMFLPLKPPSAHKNGPLWNPSSVEKAWMAAMIKGNEIYKQISHKDFGKSISFYAKYFRLTFKYVKVNTKTFNFQCLVSDRKPSKNVHCSIRIYRAQKMFVCECKGRWQRIGEESIQKYICI